MASRLDKEKGVNVQVLLRCRPFNDDELRSNAPQVVTCRDHQREVAVSQNIAGKQHDRVFIFDKVFGPQSLQKDLYDQAIVPIVNEVLEGFNCTIFAYGQTGTGKTYTMEGAGRNSRNGELPQEAGVIPRAIKQIFDTLEMQNAEYSVKVTFLELYNEETTDLLAPDDISRVLDDRRRPLSLMEDGKGGVIVRGLEEVIVTNSIEIFNLLDRGSAKRRTAETLLNKQSSRSHSIFSITIHIKEATAEGEELMKCGKLNLVDLAGSENICRSGAREGRAREAGEINKSLLTLGRVITSLVEHLGHVPYRDSKLTRLLRDSLGGRTKTCIIATVSPSVHCLEETMSTLDYAQRAKSIKNKPEVNQKLMKTTLIKELYGEIDRLKTELHAAREKNGVYIPQDRFYQDEADKKAMAEKIERVENELVSTRKLLGEMQSRYELEHELCSKITTQLDQKQKDLEETKQDLLEAQEEIQSANHTICEKEEVIMSQQQAESLLIEKTNAMRSSFEQTILDVNSLFSKIERKKQVETGNMKVIRDFQAELLKCLDILRNDFAISLKQQQDQIVSFDDQTKAFLASKQTCAQELKAKIEDLKLLYFARLQGLFDLAQSHENTTIVTLDNVIRLSSDYAADLQNLLRDAVLEAELVLQDLEGTLLEQQNEVAAFAQQQREGAHTTLMATKEIAKATLDAFDQLAGHANELSSRINDCSQAQEHSLAEFERNFQEQARQEEEQMLQDIATLLTNTRARKTALVHGMVSTLRDQSAAEKSTLQDGIKEVRSLACVCLNQWGSFLCQAEATSADEVRQLAARHCQMEALIQKCIKERHDVSKHWSRSQNLVEQCARSNLSVIESTVREAQGYCGRLQDSFEQEILAADVEMEVCRGSLIVGTEVASNVENDMEKMIQSTVSSQLQGLVSLGMCHDSRVEDVQRLTTGCLEDVREDQPTNMTPTRRDIYVLSRACIEELRAATADVLIRKYQERMGIKENGVLDRENITGKPLHHNAAPPTRIPLARLN